MRFTRVLTLLLGVALLGLPGLVLSAGGAAAVDGTALTTEIRLERATSVVRYKGAATSTWQLRASDESGNAYLPGGETVHLERKLVGDADFHRIAEAVTDAKGRVTFTATGWRNGSYRVVYDGGTYGQDESYFLEDSTSPEAALQVARRLNDSSKRLTARTFRIRGNVDPGWARHSVYLQRKTCASCAWKAVTRTTTTDTGAWAFTVGSPRTGRWYYRAYTPATNDYALSYTTRTYYTYRR